MNNEIIWRPDRDHSARISQPVRDALVNPNVFLSIPSLSAVYRVDQTIAGRTSGVISRPFRRARRVYIKSHGDPAAILRQPITFISADAAECAVCQFLDELKLARAVSAEPSVRERERYRKIRKNKLRGAMDEGTGAREQEGRRERERERDGRKKKRSAIKRLGGNVTTEVGNKKESERGKSEI